MKKLIAICLLIAAAGTTSAVDPSYGWQGCDCYHVIVGGTAAFPYKVPASDCIKYGHPKPAGCK